ncbi:MAG: nucleoside diphosphate kinase regulator [Ignavibacteriae bacterium]|nr:MAG: nucleoside diphosphate kinase regulator [Ignavibacteriota bacterium]
MKTTQRQIYITDSDHKRLTALLGSQNMQNGTHKEFLNNLRRELDRARVVPSEDIPEDVVTMHSQAILTDLNTGEKVECTLVFPGNADFDKNKISILAPVGTAIIGCRVKDIIDFEVPAGRTRLRIERILYQPEAAGDLHL